jgi:hypothetical protein
MDLLYLIKKGNYKEGLIKDSNIEIRYLDISKRLSEGTLDTYKYKWNEIEIQIMSNGYKYENIILFGKYMLHIFETKIKSNLRGFASCIINFFYLNGIVLNPDELNDIKITSNAGDKSIKERRVKNKEFIQQAPCFTQDFLFNFIKCFFILDDEIDLKYNGKKISSQVLSRFK